MGGHSGDPPDSRPLARTFDLGEGRFPRQTEGPRWGPLRFSRGRHLGPPGRARPLRAVVVAGGIALGLGDEGLMAELELSALLVNADLLDQHFLVGAGEEGVQPQLHDAADQRIFHAG